MNQKILLTSLSAILNQPKFAVKLLRITPLMHVPVRSSIPVSTADDADWQRFLKTIGRSLLARRVSTGMTQQQAAERVGIQPESVSRIEHGQIAPTLMRLRQFAAIYDCSITALVGQASEHPTDLALRIAHELSELGESDRQFVASQAVALAWHLRNAGPFTNRH
jgi:transcriptional regulator with XRE-family HTH domain